MNTSNNPRKPQFRKPLPIRFDKLEVGSHFRIFAEPTRDIAKSTDTTVYQKMAESWSEDTSSEGKPGERRAIILYPEDRVIPLTRPSRKK